jgi:hypothetical protein
MDPSDFKIKIIVHDVSASKTDISPSNSSPKLAINYIKLYKIYFVC